MFWFLDKAEALSYRVHLAVVFLVSVLFFFSRIYEPSLSFDEAKYALIARNMLETKDFLIPNLGVELYFKKPPFFFWMMALSMKLFGVSEFSVRFPSAFFAVADALVLWYLAYRVSGRNLVATLTALAFVANFEVLRVSTIARFESSMLFVNLTCILLLGNPTFLKTFLSFLLLTAGLLTKGPFALPGAVAVFIYRILKGDFKGALHPFVAVVASVLVFFGYLIAVVVVRGYPQFVKEFFGNQIAGRFLGHFQEGNPRSFFFYERIIFKHFWMWNLLLLFLPVRLLRVSLSEIFTIRDKNIFIPFVVYFFLLFLPFHLVSVKFTRYSYYLYPFLAFVVANVACSVRKVAGYTLMYSTFITFAYLAVVAICPCKFHRDILADLRPIVQVGLQSFKPLGISRSVDKDTLYTLLFYFPLNLENPHYVISKGKECESAVFSYRGYCITGGGTPWLAKER